MLNRVMRVIMVHDYLVQGIRGAERVVQEIHDCFPDAPIYTLLYDPVRMGQPWTEMEIHASLLQRLPGALRLYRKLYVLMPLAIELMRLPECDVVLSSSSAWAKNVRPPLGALHICYCHTPARFLWHWSREYVASLRLPAPARWLVQATLPPLRWWDRRSTPRVHAFIANSRTTQERIRRYYGRESVIIHPPVDTDRFRPSHSRPEDYFLVVSTLNPYKRVDLAIEACNRLGARLKVVGDGPLFDELKRLAGPTVEMLGKVPDDALPDLYARCRAFLMPQEEDFGIAPVEAQAAGRPVVAYAGGGALETVVDGVTGVLFSPQTPEAMIGAIRKLDTLDISPEACRKNAQRFSRRRFRDQLKGLVSELWQRWQSGDRGVLV